MSTLSPVNQRRLQKFRNNRRAWWSLWIFLVLFVLSLLANVIANDRPIVVKTDQGWFFPVLQHYSEKDFGGDLDLSMDYRDPFSAQLIEQQNGRMIWPPVRYSWNSINYEKVAPSPPRPGKPAGYR
jgi:microcin C transport system permease protein